MEEISPYLQRIYENGNEKKVKVVP
jgi:hypothetical protein